MKKASFIISIILLLSFLQRSNAAEDGILLDDVPNNSYLSKLHLQSRVYLNSIILLPETSFDEKSAGEMIKRIDHLPTSILKKMVIENIKIRLFEGSLTDLPTANHLKGETPRGYKNLAITWDDVPGAGGSRVVLVKIGHSQKGMGHGSVNLELHELAHTLDKMIYNGVRFNNDFKKIWKNEVTNVFGQTPYFQLYPEEYFAECFAMFYLEENTNKRLQKLAPQTYQFIKQLNEQ